MSFKKFFIFSFIFLFFLVFSFVDTGQAAQDSEQRRSLADRMAEQDRAFVAESGYSPEIEINNLVADLIRMVLSLLGIIFVVLIIFSGYQWMMAGGNEEQVKKAQSRIKNAIIGVVIVVLAYSITAFVFQRLPGASRQIQTTDPQNPPTTSP